MGWQFKISIGTMLLLITSVFMLSSDTPIIDPLLNFFLYSIPSNAAISFLPHEPILMFLGSSYDPIILALIGTASTLIAGILDYFIYVPLLSHNALKNIKETSSYQKAIKWFGLNPFLTLIVAGLTPVPFFLFKIISFSYHYPLPKYLSALAIGRFPRYFLLAYAGEVLQVPGWILITVFIIMVALFLIKSLPHLKDLLFRDTKERKIVVTILNTNDNGVKSKCNLDMQQ